MATITVHPGQTVVKDPNDIAVVQFDWDTTNLATGVQISSSSMAIAAYRPSTATVPTLDQSAIVSGNRKTQTRITGGTAGAIYKLTNEIVTNESPAQTKNRFVFVQVQDL